MKRLFLANANQLFDTGTKDSNLWREIYCLISVNVSLIDRSEQTKMPFKYGIYEPFKLNTDVSSFTQSFEEVCHSRVQFFLDLQAKIQKPIYLLYSGGIDSTLMLVSFLKHSKKADLRDRVHVLMNSYGIWENPNFYYKYVRSHFSIFSSDNSLSYFDGRGIMVVAEHCDQLFGSDICLQFAHMFSVEQLLKPLSSRVIRDFFMKKGMSKAGATAWYELIVHTSRIAPCQIKTVFDFFWWFNFVFKWQSVYFRTIIRAESKLRSKINQTFLDQHYHHFYSSEDFQKWSMVNPHLKIKKTWNSYKFHAKDLIYDFNKDANYRDYKVKIGSLFRLFISRNTAMAITEDFEFLNEFDHNQYYQKDNWFRNCPL